MSITAIFTAIFYQPLYNALVGLIGIVPFADVGIAVIVLTVVVKLALFPLSQAALRTQKKMKELEAPLQVIKDKHKDNPQALAKETMELYRSNKVNPFAGILTMLIQIPILFGLYFVFYKGGLPIIDMKSLYSFIPVPEIINMKFLGLIDIHQKSTILAVIAAVSQFVQAHFSLRNQTLAPSGTSFKDDMMRGMHIQMRYVLPFIIFSAGSVLAGAVPLYWTISNLFIVGQEIYLKRHK